MSLELILARIEDVEDYVDQELDALDNRAAELDFVIAIEGRLRRESDIELSRRLDALEEKHARLALQHSYAPGELASDEVEKDLAACISLHRACTFKYRDAEGDSSYRVVSPYELHETTGGFTSLVCYDHGREAPRHFRVERIEGAVNFTDAEDYREPQEG